MAIASHTAAFTSPKLDHLLTQRHGLARTFAASYGGKTLVDFLHGWAYFHLMGQLGATSMSVMKAAVAAASFAVSLLFFCNTACCVDKEQRPGFTCPAPPHAAPWLQVTPAPPPPPPATSAFFCHFSPAQCFSIPKGLSLTLVLAGVLLYSRAGRFHLEDPPGVAVERTARESRDGRAERQEVRPGEEEEGLIGGGKRDDADQWRLATWRWLSR